MLNRSIMVIVIGVAVILAAVALYFVDDAMEEAGGPPPGDAAEVANTPPPRAETEPAAPAETTPTPAKPTGDTPTPERSASERSAPEPEPDIARQAPSDPVAEPDAESQARRAEPAPAGEPASAAEAPEPAPAPPSFDVVRVNPDGDTVMAGRAVPGARVTILDGGEPIGAVTADDRGEWIFLPEAPLTPGNRELGLRMERDTGGPVPSESVVVLAVPDRAAPPVGGTGPDAPGRLEAPLAVEMPRQGDGPSRVLQKPSTSGDEFRLTIDSVDYDADGLIGVSGRALPGATVQVYLDDDFVGRTVANDDGGWVLAPDRDVAPGLYTLRADQVDDSGQVMARIAVPFSLSELLATRDSTDYIVVQPGNSLWEIARGRYGSGFNYTVIFEANKEQIRDPDLIYPGQVFSFPRD